MPPVIAFLPAKAIRKGRLEMEDNTMMRHSPELQVEFDQWEQASDESLRKFEAGEYEGWQKNSGAFATIRFLSNGEGGRSLPVLSGYPGQFYDGETDWDAVYTFASQPVLPGQTVNAYIEFRRPEAQCGQLHVGMVFHVREGNRAVGEWTLTWVSANLKRPQAVF